MLRMLGDASHQYQDGQHQILLAPELHHGRTPVLKQRRAGELNRRRLARNMRRILAGMREIEDRILGIPNAAAILRTFFHDFVDGLLIADYKQLKTSNNP
ncbi:hypothetical protein BJA5080_07891 [Bradyrhizobium diazoefficiens SEMIA 5080]|uniref:Transposase n=2 Tax=Nitrobacteraceae TaxID=41294 RepID=A0A837CPY6_9BRAD|nr:hypothetical protein BJA5080_07891 [Bradyrhizobium diazoefficiens SEMIA 5080]